MADEEKLTIAVSRNFPKERLDDVIAVFSEYQKIEGPYERIQKSLESTLPKFIEFIGNYIIWAPFAIFGTSFLSRLGSRFADFTIEKIELALENEESKQFARIVRHLAEARRDLGESGEIVFGLPVPHKIFGTFVRVKSNSAEEIALQFSLFLKWSQKIQEFVEEQSETESPPVSHIEVEFIDGVPSLSWFDQKGHKISKTLKS